MGFKNTSIGQVLGVGALGYVAYQAYQKYSGMKSGAQKMKSSDDKLDGYLEDSFPASDPMPLSRSGAMK